jgi:hypothetical protein
VAGVLSETETLGALIASGGYIASPIGDAEPPNLFSENREIEWYASLSGRSEFEVYWGPSGTGDVYDPRNLRGLAERVLAATDAVAAPAGLNAYPRRESVWGVSAWTPEASLDFSGADIVGADGGFEIPPSDGAHFDNFQELFCARIIVSECLSALQTLRPGGGFICKLFDTLSDLSASTIYLMLAAFDSVHVVKPERSRASNSERYLACAGFRGRAAARPVLELLTYAHSVLFIGVPGADAFVTLETPAMLYPMADVRGRPRRAGDARFRETFSASVTTLLKRQTEVLKLILDATYEDLGAKDRLSSEPV